MMLNRNRVLFHFIQQQFLKYPRFRVECSKYCQQVFTVPCLKLHSQEVPAQKVKLKIKESIEPVNKFVNRSHTCGELTINNIGETVQICGWLEFQRGDKFLILRDSYGSIQCIIDKENTDLSEIFKDLPYETVLSVFGTVVPRPKDQCNTKMKTGDIEICVKSIEILNTSIRQLPFNIRDFNKAKESLQMQYRYLALRFPELQRNLRIRSWVTMKMREYLINQCGFVDVATPTLFRKTPGGAQEFLVPTKLRGKFYSLVQSPQQFKQLLMVGGIDRYFQIAQCYRDEGSRNDRQPEFTQLDIEMSFVDRECILNLTEQIIVASWPQALGKLEIPFKRIPYEEAMETYGVDCPDLRIPGRIYNVSGMGSNIDDEPNSSPDIYATAFSGKQQFLSKSVKEKLNITAKQIYPNVKLIQLKVSDINLSDLSKLFSETTRKVITKKLELKKDDVLLLTYGQKSDARQLLGKIRVEFTNILESKGEFIRSADYRFVWVYDMPLFSMNNDTNILETMHHPFTQPHPEDIQHLFSNPLKVRGLQYDLVLNGSEIGGGSIRIHSKSLQEKVFEMLKINSTQMYYLLEALDSGAPPHGGIAIGLDRYISMICGASSIRQVIAFPKTMEGRDLMSGAPSLISEEDKQLYHIQVSNDNLIDTEES